MHSISEDRGIKKLRNEDLNIYSIGISTAGSAEIRMAKLLQQRHIIATTIDLKGAEYTRHLIEKNGVSDQISVKIEDIRLPLPYQNNYFDFIYARLVLHYLPKNDLNQALIELHRILKPNGQIFVAVLSSDCSITKEPEATHNPSTSMTTINSKYGTYSRYFHTQKTLNEHFKKAGFSIQKTEEYDEILCYDYNRKHPSNNPSSLIEVIASK